MKMKMKTTLALLALGMSALAANAQNDNGAPPRKGHHPPPLPLVTTLDANHDGVISADEIANATAALKTLDQNNDGGLTTDEYLPPLPKDAPADAPRPPKSPVVKALDANGDGVIDANEITNASAALKSLDKNGDGRLTRDEYLGKRPGPPPQNSNGDNEAGSPPEGTPPGPPPGE
jgi:hypothetical protein